MKISYLLPNPSSEGGMTAITKMFYEIDYFDNKNIFHFNTSFYAQNKLGRFMEFFSKQLNFIIHLIKVRPDVIFVMSSSYFGFYDKCFYTLVAKLFGVKSMLNHVGGEFDKFYNSNKLNKILINLFIKFPDVLLIGSSFWCDYFAKKFPFKQIRNSPNPIIFDWFNSKAKSNPNGKFKIVSLFRITKEKGVLELIEVIQKISKLRLNVEFVIMGGGPMLEYLRDKLQENIRNEEVRVLGFVDDEVKMMEICSSDLYVMLTYFDLMPISILEAMSAGKPVLSTKVGGIPDLVKDSVNGFLFDVGEVDKVVLKIQELVDSDEECRRLGTNGARMVEREFDIKSIIHKHHEVAASLI